jgi:hypothetical protein
MSVPLLLEHVHGDPCPIVHAAVMSNRQRPGVRPRLRWRPQRCRQSGRTPGHAPRRSVRPARHPARVPQVPSVRHVPLRTGVRVPDARGAARALRTGKAREITWWAGWFRGTREAAGPGHPGGGRPRMPTFRPGPQGEKPAVRRTAPPRNGLRPRYRPPEAAAGPAVAQGCWATWLRDTGTTGHGPIRRPRAADLAVPGEGVWQSGNWPESAATCLRDPCCRCGRSGGCRGSCRRRGCWSGRRSR